MPSLAVDQLAAGVRPHPGPEPLLPCPFDFTVPPRVVHSASLSTGPDVRVTVSPILTVPAGADQNEDSTSRWPARQALFEGSWDSAP